MNYRKVFIFVSFFLFVFLVKAQDNSAVTFEMKLSKSKLGLNERLRVDFMMNKDGDNFNPPNFNGFRVLMGSSVYSIAVQQCIVPYHWYHLSCR